MAQLHPLPDERGHLDRGLASAPDQPTPINRRPEQRQEAPIPPHHALGEIHVGNHDSHGICSRCLMQHSSPYADRLCRYARAQLGTPREYHALRALLTAIRDEHDEAAAGA